MRKSWILKTAAVAATALLFVCAPMALNTEKASAATERDFPCTYSASEKNNYVYYGSSEVITYSAAEAEAAGVPAGYENNVVKVVGRGTENSLGMLVDFSAEEFPLEHLESITFRVYVGQSSANSGGYPQLRIPDPASLGSGWIWQPGSTPTATGEWTEVTVPKSSKFDAISKDGNLYMFEVGLRSNAVVPFYIDKITVNMGEGYTPPPPIDESDKEAPVIQVPVDELTVTAGTVPMLKATVTDNSGNVNVSYAWSDGALDEFGKLTVGTHTWTITATDFSRNTATKTVTVIVTADEQLGDNVVDEEEVSTRYTVTFDGENSVQYTYGWKVEKPADPVRADAMGTRYQFIGWFLGEEAWDFETDIVTGDMQLVSKWEETRMKYTVSFDGQASGEYEYGDKVVKPADPTKKETAQLYFVFDGWYNGDQKWNFDTDTVTGDLALTAKFIENKRVYTVTFDGESTAEYNYGDKIVKPEDPTKEGHKFVGWYKGSLAWNFDEYTVTENVELTAKWKKDDSAVSNDSASDEENQDTAVPEESGCGGVIGASAAVVTLLGAAVLLKKKEN